MFPNHSYQNGQSKRSFGKKQNLPEHLVSFPVLVSGLRNMASSQLVGRVEVWIIWVPKKHGPAKETVLATSEASICVTCVNACTHTYSLFTKILTFTAQKRATLSCFSKGSLCPLGSEVSRTSSQMFPRASVWNSSFSLKDLGEKRHF